MLKLKSLQQLFSKLHKSHKVVKPPKKGQVEIVENHQEPPQQSSSHLESTISKKSYLMFIPSTLLLSTNLLMPLQSQLLLSPIISLTILLPSIATTYLNIKYPFHQPQYNRFYKIWGVLSSISSIALTFTLVEYPFLINGGLLLINVASTIIEYHLRMESSKDGDVGDQQYQIEGEIREHPEQKEKQKFHPILHNKNYSLFFIFRFGVAALLVLNLILDVKNQYVKRFMVEQEERKKAVISELIGDTQLIPEQPLEQKQPIQATEEQTPQPVWERKE